jgi:hypothetical protein
MPSRKQLVGTNLMAYPLYLLNNLISITTSAYSDKTAATLQRSFMRTRPIHVLSTTCKADIFYLKIIYKAKYL